MKLTQLHKVYYGYTRRSGKELDGGSFEVHKTGTEKYVLNFQKPECTCKDWARHQIPCKHFFAVFQHFPNWNWSRLPQCYQDSCYFSADTAAVQQYIDPTMEEHNRNQSHPDVANDAELDYNSPCLPPIPKQKVILYL